MWELSDKRIKSDYIEIIGCPRSAVNLQRSLAITIYRGSDCYSMELPEIFENRYIHISLPSKTGKGMPYVTEESMFQELVAEIETLLIESCRFCDQIEFFVESAFNTLIVSIFENHSYPFRVELNTF